MKPETELIPAPAVSAQEATLVGLGAEEAKTPPLRKIDQCLRGRYVWAILLGLVLAILGGMWGYQRREPMYQSTGLIRVEPVLPRIL